MRTVLLVRHAMPSVDPTTDPSTWPLSDEGRAAAADLCARLPGDAVLVASDEVKAWQTLEPAGVVRRDARLGEVVRDEPFGGDFRARRRAYVEGVDHSGWEPRSVVAQRFSDAVSDALSSPGTPVLGTHGMALTVWLTSVGALADPGGFWEALPFPALIDVNLTEGGARLAAEPC